PGCGRTPGRGRRPPPYTAGDHVLAYVRTQVEAVVALDPAVRLDTYDSVHRMRVATRRLRSVFRSYGKVLDRSVTGPVAEELRWLAAELGVDRDREVLTARLRERLGELPPALVTGPVESRLRAWSAAGRSASRERLLAVLDGDRHLGLLDALDALLSRPPLLPGADLPPGDVLPGAVLRDHDRLAVCIDRALAAPSGPDRDLAVHDARKAAKRVRYAAEAAAPALGKPAKRLVRHMRELQEHLGGHQDSVVARETVFELAAQAHAAGEDSFTFGLMYGREERRAADVERALPAVWSATAPEAHRAALSSATAPAGHRAALSPGTGG
ncbi:CHAD domain-containing protein, partial [Streptomyces sp. Ru87]|uniref:CHAD domain-containing protein n=1 Tax=Streptomyces sp. Ru87 TaxID=2044307 RepID=UPI000C0065C1